MVEADSHLNLLPPSMSDIYKVFKHIHMLSIGIRYQPYTLIPPTNLAQILRIYVVTCGVKMMSLGHG